MLSSWVCAAAGPLPVVTGPGLGEFYAHHAVLGTALINQLPALRGSRFHRTVTAPTCTPYSVPTPGLLSCAVPGLRATRRLDGASLPGDGWVVLCVCECGCVGAWVFAFRAPLSVCLFGLSDCPSLSLCPRIAWDGRGRRGGKRKYPCPIPGE